jgi:hypothetical protein
MFLRSIRLLIPELKFCEVTSKHGEETTKNLASWYAVLRAGLNVGIRREISHFYSALDCYVYVTMSNQGRS